MGEKDVDLVGIIVLDQPGVSLCNGLNSSWLFEGGCK